MGICLFEVNNSTTLWRKRKPPGFLEGTRQIGFVLMFSPMGKGIEASAEMERKGAGFARSFSCLIGEAGLPLFL
jgi:hypothetical protein